MICNTFAVPDIDALWLTANRRLVYYWQKIYAAHLSPEKTVWEPPHILPLNAWLTLLFEKQVFDSRCILSEWQTWLLWKQSIEACTEYSSGLNHAMLIPLMVKAWNRLYLYESSLDQWNAFGLNMDMQQFMKCAQHFKKLCHQKGWITSAEIPTFLTKNFSCVNLEKPIYLLGFVHEMPKALKHFIDRCSESVAVSFFDLPAKKAQVKRFNYENTRDELYQMAHWAISTQQEHPEQHIACVIPQLSQLRSLVNTVFTEVFVRLNKHKYIDVPFNISIGKPLLNFELVKTAINLLSLPNQASIKLHDLLPPFYSVYGLDQKFVNQLELFLRQQACCAFSSEQLLSILIRYFPKNPLTSYWQSFLRQLKSEKTHHTACFWAQFFIQQLNILQWPSTQLSANQCQIVKRFQDAIVEFSKIDSMILPLTLSEALALLKVHLKQIVFQPSQGFSQPIQILGLLEAAGHSFNAMWIMGLNDKVWPASPQLNPFIPFVLQKQLAMPHASYSHELIYAQTLKHYFLTHADTVVFSHAFLETGEVIAESSLIRNIPLQPAIKSIEPIEMTMIRKTVFDKVKENHNIQIHEDEKIKGGCAILKDQALCPFRAFAHFRLKVSELIEPVMAISPLNRGQWIHAALEHFWKEVKTQEKLIALKDTELDRAITNAIYYGKNKTFASHATAPASIFLTLEIDYLKKILRDWLTLEKTRTPFKVVKIESRQSISVGPLSLNVRMDRLDQLTDGSQLVIDYKTGQTQQNHWFKAPIIEPQLPLYCAFGVAEIHGIAFAELSNQGVQFKGVSAHAMDITGIKTIDSIQTTAHDQWNELRMYWARQLIQLANDFNKGHCTVSPVDATACRYCDLQALCRIE